MSRKPWTILVLICISLDEYRFILKHATWLSLHIKQCHQGWSHFDPESSLLTGSSAMQPCHSTLCTNNGRNSSVFVWLRTELSETPEPPQDPQQPHSPWEWGWCHSLWWALTQTAGVKFTHYLKNSQPHLAIVSLMSLHNRANRLNPPWNALSRTCQHVKVCSVLCSVLIQPIECWQLSVSQTFTRLFVTSGLEP